MERRQNGRNMSKPLEGPLRRYRGVLSGYKVCFARLIADEQILVLTKDTPDRNALDGSKVDRIDLDGAEVTLPKGAKEMSSVETSSGDSLDLQFILTDTYKNKIHFKTNTLEERDKWVRALKVATGEDLSDDDQ